MSRARWGDQRSFGEPPVRVLGAACLFAPPLAKPLVQRLVARPSAARTHRRRIGGQGQAGPERYSRASQSLAHLRRAVGHLRIARGGEQWRHRPARVISTFTGTGFERACLWVTKTS